MSPNSTSRSPAATLGTYIDRLDPEGRKLVRSVRTALRKRLPTANELAYDYGRQIVIAYSPTDRGIDAVVSIVARADGVQLTFNQGKQLPDPKRLLKGSGNQARSIRVTSAREVQHPDLEALMAAAIRRASIPLQSTGKGTLIIRPTAASKRSA